MINRPASESSPAPAEGRPVRRPSTAATEFAARVAAFLEEKQGENLTVLDVSGPLAIVDYFVVATVSSTRQAQAIARELDFEVKHLRGRRKRNQGGLETEDTNWVLLDFDDVVVHLFLPEARTYYGLDSLWADAPRLDWAKVPQEQRTDQAATTRTAHKKLQLFPPPDGAK